MTSTTVTTVAVGVFVPVAAPFFLLRKGHDIVVPEGTRLEVFIDGDHLIAAEASVAAPAAASTTAAPAPTRTKLTNADVVALHKAGLGEDVILAKIAASPASFSVDASDMVALKKSGVSDKVIGAMVAAK